MCIATSTTISRFLTGCSFFLLVFGLSSLALGQEDSEEKFTQFSSQLQKAWAQSDSAGAVKALDSMIELRPEIPRLYYLRGVANFEVRNFRQSVADFDQLIKLEPRRSDELWERGISCYFAGDYEAGAKQFLDYQNYHDQDVENSVWRYLCLAKSKGVATARETLLPIERDSRPGLMEVLELYRGKLTPQQLLEKMQQTELNGEAEAGYRFYTLLYVGLYYLAEDDKAKAADYLAQAGDKKLLEAGSSRISEYMWNTARIAHAEVIKKAAPAEPAAK